MNWPVAFALLSLWLFMYGALSEKPLMIVLYGYLIGQAALAGWMLA